MFVYERHGKLNIMFQSTQIPAQGREADVVLWSDGEKVFIQIGDNILEGELPRMDADDSEELAAE